jgi:hypothetical protein
MLGLSPKLRRTIATGSKPCSNSQRYLRLHLTTSAHCGSTWIWRCNWIFPARHYRAPAGWLVRVCTQESHRNPEVFADPDRYDPDRFLDPSWNAAEYAPFGIDGHSCIGEALTRRFTSVLLVRIARSYDVVVTNDGPLEMGEFQHWTPSDDFRIRLVSREADSPPPNRR